MNYLELPEALAFAASNACTQVQYSMNEALDNALVAASHATFACEQMQNHLAVLENMNNSPDVDLPEGTLAFARKQAHRAVESKNHALRAYSLLQEARKYINELNDAAVRVTHRDGRPKDYRYDTNRD